MDYKLAEIAETKGLEKRPSEHFKSDFHACFWFEKDVSDMLHDVGIDNCLFETDFPHPTSLFPIDNLDERLSGLTQEDRVQVLSVNAANLSTSLCEKDWPGIRKTIHMANQSSTKLSRTKRSPPKTYLYPRLWENLSCNFDWQSRFIDMYNLKSSVLQKL